MNLKRILTTIVGLPIVILILLFGNKYIIDAIFAIIALASMYEYKNCISKEAKFISWVGYICAISLAGLHLVSNNVINFVATLGAPILLLILFLHVIVSDMKINFKDISFTMMGIAYIFCFLLFLPLTYGIEGKISGKILMWYIIICAWGTDTFAYLVGKHFGKIKFSKVSPNKTVEGCIAGTLAAVIISLLYTVFVNNYFNLEISYIAIGIISLVLSIIGQIGDFSASVIKRYFEVKDFSELFPGHGGMIDRIDSVMFIAPFAYLLLTMFL